MRNAAIGFVGSAALAAILRYSPGAGLPSLLFFMLAAVFAAMILVGLVSRIGHTPRGALSILAAACLTGVMVYWWIDQDLPFDRTLDRAAFAVTERAGAAIETAAEDHAPNGPHPADRAEDPLHR